MKTIKNSFVAIFLAVATGSVFGQQYQKLTGRYYNRLEGAVNCKCNVQAYLHYTASDGQNYYMTLCFDSEPGAFYQMFDGEIITVEGNVNNKTCTNGNSYLVMNVSKTTNDPIQRQMLFPEAVKKQGTSNNTSQTVNKSSGSASNLKTISGSFTVSGSTMDDWSDFESCKVCGRFGNNRSLIINFDNTNATRDGLYNSNIKVYGTQTGNVFNVVRWQKL